MRRNGEHAVVLGGSVAGLAAAATLSGRFERITIVERDVVTDEVAARRGVPQGQHIHVLLPGGLAALERQVPGLTADLGAAGGLLLDLEQHLRFHVGGGWLHPPRRDPSLVPVTATRPLIERTLRRRVAALDDVTIRGGVEARGLVTGASPTVVGGVRLLALRPGSAEQVLEADLVVDATGRGSRTPRWLRDLAFPAPPVETMGLGVRYATCEFPRAEHDLDGVREMLISAVPSGRGGIAHAVEGDRWLVGLTTYAGSPPTDAASFVDLAGTLDVPHIHDLVAGSEPLSAIRTAAFPASRRHRYDRLPSFPDGLVVLGDALCSLNPSYGQGMSVAAIEAELLGEVLDSGGLERVGRRFFARSRATVDVAWDLAIGNDLRLPTTDGTRSPRQRLTDRYGARVVRVAHHDPDVSLAFLRVIGLLDRPESLLTPRMARRVLGRGAAEAATSSARQAPRVGARAR